MPPTWPPGNVIATRSPAPGEQTHAVMEKVQGRFAVLRREMHAFRRAAGAGGGERHDARNGALRERQQRRIVAHQIGGGREG